MSYPNSEERYYDSPREQYVPPTPAQLAEMERKSRNRVTPVESSRGELMNGVEYIDMSSPTDPPHSNRNAPSPDLDVEMLEVESPTSTAPQAQSFSVPQRKLPRPNLPSIALSTRKPESRQPSSSTASPTTTIMGPPPLRKIAAAALASPSPTRGFFSHSPPPPPPQRHPLPVRESSPLSIYPPSDNPWSQEELDRLFVSVQSGLTFEEIIACNYPGQKVRAVQGQYERYLDSRPDLKQRAEDAKRREEEIHMLETLRRYNVGFTEY